jgi:hypothetical protein
MVRLRSAILLLAVAMLGTGGPVWAQSVSLRDMLGERQDDRRAAPPAIARYVAEEGQGFVLDRTRQPALLKFDQSPEVWALAPSPASRGDVIYRNDVGQPVLRATRLGGLTLFTRSRPGGAPAALIGEAGPLVRPTAISPSGLLQKLAQASVKATGSAKRLIPFEANGVTPGDEPVFADAAAITADAIVRLGRTDVGRGAVGRVRKVRLLPGKKASVTVQGGVLQIVVNPALGMAGRPSSDRIIVVAQAGP